MPEVKGLDLTIFNLPEKYKERILERRRTHGTRRTTFRDFKIILPSEPAEQPRTPEQILQRPENVFDNNFKTSNSVSSKRKSVHDDDDDDDEEYEQLETPTSKMKNNDRSRSSQMSLGSPMEIDYSIDVGNIEVLVSKAKYNDNDEERSDIVMMEEVDVLDKLPVEQLDTILNKVDIPEKSLEEQLDIVMEEVNEKVEEDEREVDVQAKSLEEQSDIIMGEGKVAKSSDEHTEEIELSQNKRRSSRHTIMSEDDVEAKSSEEQIAEISKITEEVEEVREISKGRKKPTRRKSIVRRGAVKNNGKASAKSPEQIDTIMNDVVLDKPSEEQEQQITEITEINEESSEISQNRKRPTRNKNKVGRKPVKNKGKAAVRSPEKLDVPEEDIPAVSLEDQDVAEESLNQPSEEAKDLEEEEAFEEQVTEEREISRGRKKSSRLKIKCHKIGSGAIQDKDGNIVKKTSAAKLNEIDIIGDSINDTITEFLNDNSSFKKEIQYFKNEIESNILEQSDLLDEQIMLRSSLRKSKTRMNCLRREMLDVQRKRDKVRKELVNERRTFVNEEQERKKLEQAHNFLTDLETLREVVDAEDNMQEDHEDDGILDGFKGLLVSVTSRKGRFDTLSRFNMLLEVCEKIVRQATDT